MGGFSNRLRAIASAALWAEDLGAKLEIFWPVEAGVVPCRIEELIEINTIPYITYTHVGYIQRAHNILGVDDMKIVVKIWEKAHEIRIESYAEFHEDIIGRTERGLTMLRRIKIRKEIVANASDLAKELGIGLNNQWIGVHIRRTDHKNCIAASPIELFLARIETYLEVWPDTMFFLATDDPAVKADFSQKFAKSMVVYNSQLGRRSMSQMKDGIVEWLLLQKCSSILGSKGSSFSEMASAYSGASLSVLPGEFTPV